MVQSGVVQSPFRRGRGVANKRGLRVRKVKKKNLTEKLLPSWPTLTLAFEVLAVSFQVSFLRLLAADCVFDASRVSTFHCSQVFLVLGTCPVWATCVGCGKVKVTTLRFAFPLYLYHPTSYLSSAFTPQAVRWGSIEPSQISFPKATQMVDSRAFTRRDSGSFGSVPAGTGHFISPMTNALYIRLLAKAPLSHSARSAMIISTLVFAASTNTLTVLRLL